MMGIAILLTVTINSKQVKKTEKMETENTRTSNYSSHNKKELNSINSVVELKKEPRATPELNQELLVRFQQYQLSSHQVQEFF